MMIIIIVIIIVRVLFTEASPYRALPHHALRCRALPYPALLCYVASCGLNMLYLFNMIYNNMM